MPRGYRYRLSDIGLVINQLMGTGYTATYTEKKYKLHKSVIVSGSNNATKLGLNVNSDTKFDQNDERPVSPYVSFQGTNDGKNIKQDSFDGDSNQELDPLSNGTTLLCKTLQNSVIFKDTLIITRKDISFIIDTEV